MIPLRLVIDTNILVSAAIKPDGLQRTVLLLATAKPVTLYVSATILAEYREVMARPELQIRKGLQNQFLQLIRSRARKVKPSRLPQVAKDPDDKKFLHSLQVTPVYKPGQFANYIAPPQRGINRQPIDFEYVRTEG